MNPPLAAVLGSWSFDPTVIIGLLVVAGLYLRGFRALAAFHPERFPRWRRAAFLAGLAVLLVAVASPIDAFADLLLQVHMAQHLLLMMVAPPLVWLGAPVNPILHGLPRAFLRRGLGPFLSWPALKSVATFLVHPVTAWLTFAAMIWLWHVPALYEAALRSPFWHDVEHLGFFGAALLFWFPVVQPWPSRPVWPRAAMLPYLALAGVQTTVFSAVFAFSERVFYPSYAEWPRLFGMSAIADQQAAGAVMWVPGSIVLLIAICAIAIDALDTPIQRAHTRRRAPGPPSRRRLDVLRLGWLGPALRSLRVRRSLQGLMLGLAALIVADGLFGAQEISALNLAGVLPWTYWRGFVVIGLLVMGNVFCAVCPFTLSRSLAGRLLGQRLRWPRVLDNKWTALGLFVAYLSAYEAFALWDSPLWTAWLVLGYFIVCFVIEGLFPRGTFCRHVCPIGQFQFVGAGVSPLEVQRIDSSLCGACQTHDCLRGNDEGPGCPTGLFLPTKRGSLDCTFCLDCVRACPHDNGGLVAVTPAAALGTGRAPALDLAALSLVFCFGAFTNAAAMIAPVSAWERTLGLWLGADTRFAPLAVGLGFGLVVAPSAAALVCGWTARVFGRVETPMRVLVARLAPALVPVGFSMWLAHFGFHLVTGLGTLGPAAARAASDAGLATTRDASMLSMLMGPIADTLEGLQIAVLGAGLVVSIAVAWRLSLGLASRPRYALGVAAPWALLVSALYGAGVWIVLQPMEMRGMMM